MLISYPAIFFSLLISSFLVNSLDFSYRVMSSVNNDSFISSFSLSCTGQNFQYNVAWLVMADILAPDLWREIFHPSLLSMMSAMGVSQIPFINEEAPSIPNLSSIFYHKGCLILPNCFSLSSEMITCFFFFFFCFFKYGTYRN